MPFYAVARGNKVGVYTDWETTKAQTDKFKGAVFKKFKTKPDALAFIKANGSHASVPGTGSKGKSLRSSHPLAPFYEQMRVGEALLTIPNRKESSDMPTSNTVDIYCDGASRNNGKANAVAGYGVYIPSLKYSASCNMEEIKTDHRPTNQTMELLAIKHSLQYIRELSEKAPSKGLRYNICTDSQFSINCIDKWGKKWKTNGWKKSDGSKVIHADIIEDCMKLRDIIARLTDDPGAVRFTHVRGHSGIPGNEAADRLANEACDRMSSSSMSSGRSFFS